MKTITRQQYLIALGLFTVAASHMRKVEEFEAELNAMLCLEQGSHISDAMYTANESLDAALKREGIAVEDVA